MSDTKTHYVPLHSLGCKYEIEQNGHVRNARTKRKLKISKDSKGCKVFKFHLNGKWTSRTIRQLLFEAFGKSPPKNPIGKAVSVTLIKDNVRRTFLSIGSASRFLNSLIHYSVDYLKALMVRRPAELFGWQIFYREPEKRIVKSASIINGDKYLHRENKYFEKISYSDNKTAPNVVQ